MKTLQYFLIAALLFSVSATASAFPKSDSIKKVKVVAPVYQVFKDCDLTYYRTKINGESILVDSKGRLVKYLCDSEDTKGALPAIFKVILVPVTLLTGLQ